MIVVKSNDETYAYDVNSIIKSFYPSEELKISYEDTVEDAFIELNIKKDANSYEIILHEREDVKEEIRTEKINLKVETPSELKNAFKQDLYKVLQKATNKSLPWGILTGIRPTKIAMAMIEEGKDLEEIRRHMREVYYANEEKAALSVDIAKREHDLLKDLHYENGYSLYIGIPFCPTTCLYCSFTSYPIAVHKKKVDAYISALEKELEFVAETHKEEYLDTIYIGGGTPTTLSPEELDRILKKIEEVFDLSHLKEFTVEAGRPDSITREKLEVLKTHNITRISVNPQTMNLKTLKFIGRQHTVEQTKEAYWLAREIGFDNINMDLILGLPGENEEDVSNTIEEVKKLAPDSLTIHSLAIKRASRLNQWIEQNGISMLKNTQKCMEIATEGVQALDMKPYYLYRQKNMSGNFENVGYAKEGKYGIYNILIMEELQTIVACGAGTVTKRVFGNGRIERCDNVKDVGLYIEKIDEMIERKQKLFSLK